MSRSVFALAADDISAFARALRSQLAQCEHLPSHLEMLNMLARAGGHRNFQHFRAVAEERLAPPPASPPTPDEGVDQKRVERVARLFDAEGRLTRWPGKESWRVLCLWHLWSTLPAGETFAEPQINALLNARHLFEDHALLRREMADRGMVWRTADGRAYRRIEQRPPKEALALIRQVAHGSCSAARVSSPVRILPNRGHVPRR